MDGERYAELLVNHLKALQENELRQVEDYLETLTDDERQAVIDTGVQFHKASAVNGTWFWKTVPQVAVRLQADELSTWLAEGMMICRGSWECGLSFLKASPDALSILDNDTFLAWTRIGRVLVRYSNHDANWFFKNSDLTLRKMEDEEKKLLTGWVLKILECSWQAAVACFKSWTEVTYYLARENNQKFLELGLKLSADFSEDSTAFFTEAPLLLRKAGSEILHGWAEAAYLMEGSRRGVVGAYLRFTPRMAEKDTDVTVQKFTGMALMGKRLASIDNEVVEEFFEKSPLVLKYLEWSDLERWVALIENINRELSGAEAADFVRNSPELINQLDIRELGEWVRYGLEVIKNDKKSAYFALRSQESRDNISKLRSGLYLEAVKKVLLLYCEGLTGETVIIRNSSELPGVIHGDDRLFGTLDTRRLYLPDVVKLFDDDRANLRFYRVMLMHLVAHRQFGSFALAAEDVRELAVNRLLGVLFEHIEDCRVDFLALKANPGFGQDLRALLEVEKMSGKLRDAQANLLMYLKMYCFKKCLGLEIDFSEGSVSTEMNDQIASYWDKVVKTGASARESLLLARRLIKQLYDREAGEILATEQDNVKFRGKLRFDLIYTSMKLDEELDGENNANTVQKGLANDEEGLEPFDETRVLPNEPQVDLKSEFYVWLKKLLNKFYEDEQNPYRMIAYYDEWDRTLNDYKKDWCKVREILLKPSTGIFVTRTLEEHYGMISTLKRYFGMLRPDRFQRYYRQEDGEDIDIDAIVEAMIDKKAGVSPGGGFYVRRDKRERDVAVGFLLDLSYSTEEVISDSGKTMLDVEKESVIVMAEALEVLGDKYGIYGFTSDGRDKINFYVVKDFDEQYTNEVKQRFGGLQSYGMTRLAAAIRHAVFKMEKIQAAIKILIILSDGRPFDFDYKSGVKEDFEQFYAETDTRMALRESKMKGVNPFCITVDAKGKDYLEYIFGNISYIIIDDVHALPTKLTETYKNLTT